MDTWEPPVRKYDAREVPRHSMTATLSGRGWWFVLSRDDLPPDSPTLQARWTRSAYVYSGEAHPQLELWGHGISGARPEGDCITISSENVAQCQVLAEWFPDAQPFSDYARETLLKHGQPWVKSMFDTTSRE